MGIRTITPEREVSRGDVAAPGGSNVGGGAGGGKVPMNPYLSVPDARKMRLESLRPIGEALRTASLANEGNEIVGQIRQKMAEMADGVSDGDAVRPWKDDKGVDRVALNALFDDDGVSSDALANEIGQSHRSLLRNLEKSLSGKSQALKNFVHEQVDGDIENWRARFDERNVTRRLREGVVRAGNNADAQASATNADAVSEIQTIQAQSKDLLAAGEDAEKVMAGYSTRRKAIVQDFVVRSVAERQKAVGSMIVQSGGVMSQKEAERRVSAIYDQRNKELIVGLARSGNYDEARDFVNSGHLLGYSEATKTQMLKTIDGIKDENDIRSIAGIVNDANLATAETFDENGAMIQGRSDILDESIAKLKKVAEGGLGVRPKGIVANSIAELNKRADSIAQQEMVDEYLAVLNENPDANIFVNEERDKDGKVVSRVQNSYKGRGRKERLAEGVQRMIDEQRISRKDASVQDERALWKANMLEFAGRPGEYLQGLFEAVKGGRLRLRDYLELRQSFADSWAKGGVAGEKSRKQIAAEGMLGSLKRFLGDEELDTNFEWNEKKNGLSLKKDADYTGSDFTRNTTEVRGKGIWERTMDYMRPGGFFTEPKEKVSFSAEEVEKILDFATRLSYFDGMTLSFDPITKMDIDFFDPDGKRKIDPKTPFSAAQYFDRYLNWLKDDKRVRMEGEALVGYLGEATMSVSDAFAQSEQNRVNALKGDADKKRKSAVTIRNKKTSAGSAPAK